MTTPDTSAILGMFLEVAPPSAFQRWAGQQPRPMRQGIYSPALVSWLMIFQRLEQGGSLAVAVAEVSMRQVPEALRTPCKRVREGRISLNTGGYCRARQQLPMTIVESAQQHILTALQQIIAEPDNDVPGPMYLLDGSSLQLSASPKLRQKYPPASNQHGDAHWPVVRVVVAHNLTTGLALRPQWGPMYGEEAVSEQKLAEPVIEQLPADAVVIGDRNFGVFSIAYAAHRKQHGVLLRLSEPRARHLSGDRRLPVGSEWQVDWRPTRDDRRGHPDLPADAAVGGRVLACALPGWRPIYLFTTLPLSADRLVELYARRWNIETDLRSLKAVVRLDRITAQTEDVMQKELLLAIAAYNLVRAVMLLAARAAGLQVRRLSFTRVLYLVQAYLRSFQPTAPDEAQRFTRLVELASQCKLPLRKGRPPSPRAVWGRGYRYPPRKA